MVAPLMPLATAIWLIDNTSLTFKQIADFCELHETEVNGIADGDVARGILGFDPITACQLTKEEIIRCEKDKEASLVLSEQMEKMILISKRDAKKKGRYVPIARRQDKPSAVAWLLKNCPEMNDSQIMKLIGTTKTTIAAIRNKTHWNFANIKLKDPVLLGVCTQTDLNREYEIAKKRFEDKMVDNENKEDLDSIDKDSSVSEVGSIFGIKNNKNKK